MEIGPIRPPSEAWSLLLRVTRNCPWNRCTFCPVYKGAKFSIRSVQEVCADIDAMAEIARRIEGLAREAGRGGRVSSAVVRAAAAHPEFSPGAGQVATFLATGGRHAFLQDANSLAMRPEQLVRVLEHLTATFTTIDRITTYARAHTITRRKPEQLAALRAAGLSRVHVGLESGSDRVLELMRKGADAARHIDAGLRVKAAGMELSEYLMPGLGGRAHWEEHATESARVLSAIDPHFIRLRSTAVAPGTALADLGESGQFEPMDDVEVVREIRRFLVELEVSSTLQSDHVLNLLPELEGKFPEEKQRLIGVTERFLNLPARLRRAFVVGRRAGRLSHLDHLERPRLREEAFGLLERVEAMYGEGDQALHRAVQDLMTRLV